MEYVSVCKSHHNLKGKHKNDIKLQNQAEYRKRIMMSHKKKVLECLALPYAFYACQYILTGKILIYCVYGRCTPERFLNNLVFPCGNLVTIAENTFTDYNSSI